jgi:hypothetical protein
VRAIRLLVAGSVLNAFANERSEIMEEILRDAERAFLQPAQKARCCPLRQ